MTEKHGCLFGWLLSVLAEPDQSASTDGPLPYTKREYFFSKAERSFYGVLKDAVGTDYALFAKVRLCDLVSVEKGTEKRQSFQNKIEACGLRSLRYELHQTAAGD